MTMDLDPEIPARLRDISPEVRKFLAGIDDDEIPNLRIVAQMRKDEVGNLVFVTTKFTREDLQTLYDGLENMRTIRRFGVFGVWFCVALGAGAAAVGLVKGWVWTGVPK